MHLTPIKAIRAKCLDCCCDHPREVRLCQCDVCPLWGYRMCVRPGHPRAQLANEDVQREKLRATPRISAPEVTLKPVVNRHEHQSEEVRT